MQDINNTQELSHYSRNKEYYRNYYKVNKERIKQSDSVRYKANKEARSQAAKEYYQKNKEKLAARSLEYARKHKKEIKERTELKRDRIRAYYRNYIRRRYKTDPQYKLKLLLGNRMREALRARGFVKTKKTIELVGCSIEHLKEHLTKQFQTGMSWDNYGDCHVDHIKPCTSFDLTDSEQQKNCFHYTNLQPLWGTDNILKSDN